MLGEIIKKRRLIIVWTFVFFFVLLSSYFVLAQERELEVEYPEIKGLKPETVKVGLPTYVKYIFNLAIALSGLVLFAVIVWGGYLYLISTGQPAKLQDARERIIAGFLGVIILLSGYIILTTINPQLVIFELSPREKVVVPEYQPVEYKSEETTEIFREIPEGQMVEKGLWEKKRTTKLKALLISSKWFLEKKIEVGSPAFNRISDLNKYLKTLTERCRCGVLDGICLKPKNLGLPVGCFGDPCKEVREKMNKVLKINEEKSNNLRAYKEKLIETKNLFEEEGRKFRNVMWEKKLCKLRGLLNRAEYYDSLAFSEDFGGKTELIQSYLPASKDDPLVFYCSIGGTIYDYFTCQKPEGFAWEEIPRELPALGPGGLEEPLSCPIIIPVGEVVTDRITAISYETNTGLEELIYYIDKMLAELSKMAELISQCNESRCNINCACIPNPCFEPACGLPPARTPKCGVGRCTPPTPATPNFCYFFCDSPCLQAIGGCYGEPCPREEIIETTEKIKIYEDEIFALLEGTQGSIEDANFILRDKENPLNLNTMRVGTQVCLSLGPTGSWKEPQLESFWVLSTCNGAIGNKGPAGGYITDCHPQNLFCCSSEPLEPVSFPSVLSIERAPPYTGPYEGPYSPTAYGYNKVPYFSQYDKRWRNQRFGCDTTVGQAGSAPTSMAMALNYFGVETDPSQVADWILENDYRVCRGEMFKGFCSKVVEELGKDKDLKSKDLSGDIGAILEELENSEKKVALVAVRAAPPHPEAGHFLVLTGIEEEWDEKFVYYNDPGYDLSRPERRPTQGKKPADWFEKQGISAGCLIYK